MAPRSKHYLLAAALAALVAVSPAAQQSTAQTPAPAPYINTFDGYVMSEPLPYGANASLDVLAHSRERETWRSLSPMAAEHGSHCEAPPATHQLTGSYDDAVFLCSANPHVMTAMKEGGYGVIYLTPGALADFTDGETVIKLDISTLRTAPRDWWDIWVTPFDDAMAAPLGPHWPDLSGPPKRGIHIDMSSFGGESIHTGTRVENHVENDLASAWWAGTESALAAVGLTPSAQRRDTYELRISRTHVKFSLLSATTGQPIATWVDKELDTPLDWSKGVVQFGHHSYNPEKDCTVPAGTIGCRANTWHWDNLSISRTSPLTIVPAVERWANATSPVYSFPRPAPAGAMLQIHALATTLEYSLDNGTTWAEMGKQASATHKWGGRRTFWQSVPEGTTRVMLRGAEETGPWDANHAVLLSQQQASQPTPTPPPVPPTSTPVPTETPVPPTNTAGPTETPQPIPTATFTPMPATSTPLPLTATPGPSMPAGDCTLTRAGTPVATWECD